jgi:hypothetical protein
MALRFNRNIENDTFFSYSSFYSVCYSPSFPPSSVELFNADGVIMTATIIETTSIAPKHAKLQKYPNRSYRGPPTTGPSISPIPVTASAYPRYYSRLSAYTNVMMA